MVQNRSLKKDWPVISTLGHYPAGRILRIFISSPGDVGEERVIADRVVQRLKGEFDRFFTLEPILWEHEPLRATGHFQEQIIAPSKTDVLVCILWSRLGTRLPKDFTREDGTPYASGTEWEFEDTDPIVGTTNYFGAHVSRAARVEPITPEGSVYVTEHLAAGLALDPAGEFDCDYDGTIPAAKGYGDLGMYLLRARAPTRS